MQFTIKQLLYVNENYGLANGTRDFWLQTTDDYCFCVEKPDLSLCERLLSFCPDELLNVEYYPSKGKKDQRRCHLGLEKAIARYVDLMKKENAQGETKWIYKTTLPVYYTTVMEKPSVLLPALQTFVFAILAVACVSP